MMILSFGREEATRTPDPYVPNVVRYQLRYFSKCGAFLRTLLTVRSLPGRKAGNPALLYFRKLSPVCERSRLLSLTLMSRSFTKAVF